MSGVFISVEGGEGSGKSTQLAMLAESFAAEGRSALFTREPGGAANAEAIRQLLVSGQHEPFDALAETLLFCAARVEHVQKIIRPALGEGQWVVCDRFLDSTRVYQGIGKAVGEDYVLALHRMLLGQFQPQLTLVFDIDPVIGLARAQARQGHETRFESLDLDFHRSIREGFLSIAAREPERCVVLDANQPADMLHQAVLAVLRDRLS